jgi:hypothetical protein
VQAGHAVAEFLLHKSPASYMRAGWSNGTLIYLRVENEADLLRWLEHFIRERKDQAFFREPDWGYSLTAVAALGVDELVKDLPLL